MIDLFGEEIIENGSLRERFGVNPFTIIDTKDALWLSRKKKWLKIGIKSEVGRDATAYNTKEWFDKKREEGKMQGNILPSNTSIFDPVLCETLYNWFCQDGGEILDPFAGGSVRGIVANYLGYKYTGIDIRQEQIQSNIEQGKEILGECNMPKWICGDSNVVLDGLVVRGGQIYDMIFTCPPYADLEVYSDLPGDISNMEYKDFIKTFGMIMEKSCKCLKVGGMCVLVVGDVRDKKGFYYGFVADTIKALQKCDGMGFYNDAILATSLAGCAIRAAGNMKTKKLVKVHQNVLVFKKFK